MRIFKSDFEKKVSEKIADFDLKIKTAFALIREDIGEMQRVVEAMRGFLKKKDKQFEKDLKDDLKIRAEFERNVDEFTQKISQLRIALSEVKSLQKEVVVVRDLAKIEERIKQSFSEEINSLKETIKENKKKIDKLEKMHNGIGSSPDKNSEKKGFFGKFFEKEEKSDELSEENNNP